MLRILSLFLPALLPSWRFFAVIAPSPRLQFCLLNGKDDTPKQWHEFRPRPAHISFVRMLGRMLWNPNWNESLFLVSCAERLLETPTWHSENEIFKRIIADLDLAKTAYLQFRILVIHRHENELQQEVCFHSAVRSIL